MKIPEILMEIKKEIALTGEVDELTYLAYCSCSNCSWSGSLRVPKGIKVIDYFCQSCECKTIVKQTP